MSLAFMVIAAPRSGTAWASNWLSTDTTLCLHDPLWQHYYLELDELRSEKRLGIACTGISLFPEWVNAHPAAKVILHRSLGEINESLRRLGLSELDRSQHDALWDIDGFHVDWRDVFDYPKDIYERLLQQPFDAERHAMLCKLNVQMAFDKIEVNPKAAQRLAADLEGCMRSAV